MELNLAPIMNMVMILIPLLLVMVQFDKKGIIAVESTSSAASAASSDEQEQEQAPRLLVTISDDGFRIADQRNLPAFAQYMVPVAGCTGAGAAPEDGAAQANPTVCLRQDAAEDASLVDKLDYAALYNRLVEIRMHPEWFALFNQRENSVISFIPDSEVPFEVIVRAMDVSRYILAPAGTEPELPTAGSGPTSYQLAGGASPSEDDLLRARFLRREDVVEGESPFIGLFPSPVLLSMRSGG